MCVVKIDTKARPSDSKLFSALSVSVLSSTGILYLSLRSVSTVGTDIEGEGTGPIPNTKYEETRIWMYVGVWPSLFAH